MRKLKATDAFAFLRVLNSSGARDEVVKMSETAKAEGDKWDAKQKGAEFVLNILANCGKKETERDLYEFLSGPFEMEPEQIKDMFLDELIEKIKEFAEMNRETFGSFFSAVSKIMN